MLRMYDYQCEECGHIHEAMRRTDDTGKLVCMECGGLMARVISAPKVVSMGSEAQALKGIHAIQKKDNSKKLYFGT